MHEKSKSANHPFDSAGRVMRAWRRLVAKEQEKLAAVQAEFRRRREELLESEEPEVRDLVVKEIAREAQDDAE